MPWVMVAAFALSWALTWQVRRMALAGGLLDHPNARSSHSVPTPRGGGLSIVVTTTVGLVLLWWVGGVDSHLAIALGGGGIAIAAVGFIDDRHQISAGVRFAVHLGAAAWALAWLGGLPSVLIGDRLLSLGPAGYVLGVLAVTWALNLFNFMDGIDGIAASEAIFVTGAAALLTLASGRFSSATGVELVTAAACAGFAAWNWPPARIFMGDVGSGYLGYLIGVLAVAEARENPVAPWIWLILGGVFFVDATVTLARRLVRGERVHEAHRSHAYQWLARRWKSHKKVTLGVAAVNVLWLLPCCYFAVQNPKLAAVTALLALTPVAIAALLAGGGRRDMS